MTALPVSFFDLDGVDALRKEMRIDPGRLRQARTAFFKRGKSSSAALAKIPDQHREAFGERIDFQPLSLLRRNPSKIDDAEKLVLQTRAGYSIESVVLKPKTGRVALCISSQVGCAAACRFCATGHMGVAKDLTYHEIVAQVALVNQLLGDSDERVRNIVFMGMGEPMHNASEVTRAIQLLLDPAAFHHPASRILVSTVGVPDQWRAMARRLSTINYALSLHSALQETRQQIIPLARRHSLESLRKTVAEINSIQPMKRSVMIEYLMLDGLNDSGADADALLSWLDGLRVHVNLIPYNPISDAPELRRSSRVVVERFGERLRAEGYPTTIRYSLGQDVDAACGQLVRTENRMLHADLKKSAMPTPG